jgi:hypothetical protein
MIASQELRCVLSSAGDSKRLDVMLDYYAVDEGKQCANCRKRRAVSKQQR